jgi:hypothetical protein
MSDMDSTYIKNNKHIDRISFSVINNPEFVKRFNLVQEYLGLTTNIAVLEFLVSNYYNALLAEGNV